MLDHTKILTFKTLQEIRKEQTLVRYVVRCLRGLLLLFRREDVCKVWLTGWGSARGSGRRVSADIIAKWFEIGCYWHCWPCLISRRRWRMHNVIRIESEHCVWTVHICLVYSVTAEYACGVGLIEQSHSDTQLRGRFISASSRESSTDKK